MGVDFTSKVAKKYKSLIKKNNIKERVLLYGETCGEELNTLYDLADIGASTLGSHRIKVFWPSTLKVREYLAKGMPVLTGSNEDVFEIYGKKYEIKYAIDDSAINIERLIEYTDMLYAEKEKGEIVKDIRCFAKNTVDMQLVMKPIVEYVYDNCRK